MLRGFKQSWRRFEESAPGHRFRERYRRRQRNERGKLDPRKILVIALGIAVVAAGFVMVVFPNPGGWVVVFLGLGMIAGEIYLVARFMDRAEVRLRGLLRWSIDLWKRASVPVRILLVLAALAIAAALGYGAYRLSFG